MTDAIVISGVGLATGLGLGAQRNWEALLQGESGVRRIAGFDPAGGATDQGGECPPLPADPQAPPDRDRRDRAHRYLVAACQEAWAQAGLSTAGGEGAAPAPARRALFVGSSLAAQASADAYWASFLAHGPEAADWSLLGSYDVEHRLEDLCARFGIEGEALLVTNACAAGASAIALAAGALRLGRCDLALAAGFDALDLHTFAGFGAIKALAADATRPFSEGRSGMRLGDGFAALVLEPEARARAAGRRPLARLRGWGESADAHHLTQPHPEGRGAALAMRRALARAAIEPGAVDHVNAHATATPANDLAEARAMLAALGPRAREVPVSATKAAIGHTLGGAGAVEAVITVLALGAQELPPTLGLGPLDPEIGAPFDRVPARRAAALRTALSSSFGFGGCNAVLVLEAVRG
mgnify:CR=1 FL=1